MRPLTSRQSNVIELFRRSIRERGFPPTLRELAAQMGIKSTNGVNDHLLALERKGYLRHVASYGSRAWVLTEQVAPQEIATREIAESEAICALAYRVFVLGKDDERPVFMRRLCGWMPPPEPVGNNKELTIDSSKDKVVTE